MYLKYNYDMSILHMGPQCPVGQQESWLGSGRLLASGWGSLPVLGLALQGGGRGFLGI